MPRPLSQRRLDRRGFALLLTLSLGLTVARADNAVIPDSPEQLGLRGAVEAGLQLQVWLNGYDTRQIAGFERDNSGAFRARRADLAAIGLKTSPGPPDAYVPLSALPGLTLKYDEAAQILSLTAPPGLLAPKIYSAIPPSPASARAASDWGAAVNYDLFGSTASWWPGERLGLGSGSLTLDARAFSPLGVVSQSGILGTTAFTSQTSLRLDTSWRFDDEAHGVTYRAGDAISSGLPWTRPIRLGGFQISHDFGERPDLVQGPSATVSGTAAVPSTADVYVNNFKIYSQPVDAGPFRIDNLPAVGGGGAATVVLRDVTGKETTQTAPLFAAGRLLKPGQIDYSAEAGYARLYYGVASFDYDRRPVGSASLRAGIADGLTLEGHAEGGHGLYNGGLGATIGVLDRAVVDVSLAGSSYQGRGGVQIGFGASTALYGATLDVSFQQALRSYSDLAEVTAPPGYANSPLLNYLGSGIGSSLASPLLLSTSVAPPRSLDRISLTLPRVLGALSANLAFVNEVDGDGAKSRIASVGLSHNFSNGVSAFATAFTDVGSRRDFGAMIGLSYTFGGGITASTQSNLQGRAFAQSTEIAKSAGQEIGDFGGSINDQEGADRYGRATAAYQTAAGRASAVVTQYGTGKSSAALGSGDFAGSVAWLGGGFGFAPQISDSFAMIDAGASNVTVLEDNRPIGKTNSSGRLLVTGLRGFQDNKIGVDPTTLPLDAEIGATELTLRPRARSGLVADFKVRTDARDAEISLVDEKGAPLVAGSQVERPGGAAATVGYDGRAYLADLAAHNSLIVHTQGRTCVAGFDFPEGRKRVRATIGLVTCVPTTK